MDEIRIRSEVLRAASKSIWKERFNQNFHFFCPKCTSPRRIGMHPKPGQPIHFAQVGITAIFIAMAIAHFLPWMGARGLVSFIPLWIGFEFIYRGRVRAKVICAKCGFDPVLYLVDSGQARDAINDHWRKKFEERGVPFPESTSETNASHRPTSGTGTRNQKRNPREVGPL